MVGYTCGDCGEMRAWENVEMVAHSLDESNSFPICLDGDCSTGKRPDSSINLLIN
jgi:hypothetical protein